jgi:hypothetical protein
MHQRQYWVQRITPDLGGEKFRDSAINTKLNELGHDNWELVNVMQTEPLVLLAFFKRKFII